MINVNQEGESKNSEEEEDWEVEKKQREAFLYYFSQWESYYNEYLYKNLNNAHSTNSN